MKITFRRQSVRTQLVLWNVLALAVLLAALGLGLRYTVMSTIFGTIDQDLDMRTQPHADGPPPGPPPLSQGRGRPPGDGQFQDARRPPGSPPPGQNGGRPRWFDLAGRPLAPDIHDTLWDARTFALSKQGQTVYSTVTVNGQPQRVLSRPFPPQGPPLGVIQVAYPLAEVNRAVAGLDRALLTLIPVALLCAGLGGAALTNRVLERVRRMTQAAGQITARDFSQRLPVAGQDEFSELAETFNGLLGRLDAAFQQQKRLTEQQRRFTADASHELKTPLTIIKGNTSLALNGHFADPARLQPMQEIDRAADTMSRLVGDLLLLARSDDGHLGQNRIEMLLREILTRAISRVSRETAAPMSLTLADESLTVMGNEEELVRLFSNLLDNAARHTPADGQITVTARRSDHTLAVAIADTGVGIAPEHLPHLGERFYRVDSARSRPQGGTGLGLSICKSIVEAHGGTLTFQSAPGHGTTVTVTLPL